MDFLKYLTDPATLALVVGGGLTTIFGFIATIKKEERIPKWVIWGSFTAGLMVLIGGIYSGFEEQKMSNILHAKSEKIVNLSQKIVELEEENVKLNKTISDSITGGDSYLEIRPFIPVKSNMIQFYLLNRGEHPIYDVNIRIQDITMFKLLDYESVFKDQPIDPLIRIKDYNTLVDKASINLNIGNIPPNSGLTLGPYKITGANLDKKEQLFLIFITARNGTSSVDIKAIKKNGSWKYSWRGIDTTIGHDKKVLYEVIRDGITFD